MPDVAQPMSAMGTTEDAVAIRRAVVACAIGQVFEIFDFVIYGFFAVAIGRAFFPSTDPIASLLASFATFAVGFLMRPVGAMVIGWYGDRFGRRKALVVTVGMMAAATGVTGLIPPYATIGLLGPILLVICRMFQGFSTGGEWGGAAAFLVEHAPAGRRGLIGSLQQAATAIGAMCATFSAAILTTMLSPENFFAWGWRIPFLIGFVLGPVGYYLRTRVAETPAFQRAVATQTITRMPLADAFTTHGWVFLSAFGLSIIGCVINYVFLVFLPSFASQTLKIDLSYALWSTTLAGLIYLVLTPVVGHWSDRVGRKPMMLACAVLAFIMAYPLFLFLQTASELLGTAGGAGDRAGRADALHRGDLDDPVGDVPDQCALHGLVGQLWFRGGDLRRVRTVHLDVPGARDGQSPGTELLCDGGGAGERHRGAVRAGAVPRPGTCVRRRQWQQSY